jgi:predicted phosphoadenosine phosphosulfate sulfurtransferase
MIVQRQLDIDVLQAARQRICNIFANGLPVYLSFSGGKDSLVLADITAQLIEQGQIDAKQLRVEFIDEEAIFPCVEAVVRQWRTKFQLLGARFDWYCLEVKHFSCLNQLENDESFICFDSKASDRWVRQPPPFAIRSHPLHKPRAETYQAFLAKLNDGLHMTGVRLYESIVRRQAIAAQHGQNGRATIEPIYDWKDVDVWRYLLERNIEIPAAYLHLYQVGVRRNQLRISQFFSVDTAPVLARVAEFYPHLMERVLKREPTAYLVSLYWDSEMFRRRSQNRQALEARQADAGAREKVFELLKGPFQSEGQRLLAIDVKRLLLTIPYVQDKHYGLIRDILIAGDPKRRTFRAIITQIKQDVTNAEIATHRAVVVNSAGHVGAARRSGNPQA